MANYLSSSKILKRSWWRYRTLQDSLTLSELAKKLRISTGYLSKIFSGRSPVPKKLVSALADNLHMDSPSRQMLMQALTREALSRHIGTPKEMKSIRMEPAPLESFELADTTSEWLLGKWYRTALLDLTTLADFKNDSQWMAQRLGVPKQEVEQSLEYLKKQDLLHETSDGRLMKKHKHLRFPSTVSRKVFREHHVSQMNRAIEILRTNTAPKDFSRRLVFGITVSCNPKELEKIKLRLHAAAYDAAKELSQGPCQEIYQMNIQLFPQTIQDF